MRLAAIAAAAAIGLAAAPARGDDETIEAQKMRFIEAGDDLTVTTTITKLFDSAAYEALDSGYTSTILIRTWVYPKDSTTPISARPIERSVVYDLWDEVYVIKLDPTHKPLKTKYKSEALKFLTALDGFPVAALADMPYEQVYFLALEIELNPVSKETLAEVRRWLSQGTAGGIDRGGAFFGSFVSVFVNPKIAAADRVLRIRSQPFFRPKP